MKCLILAAGYATTVRNTLGSNYNLSLSSKCPGQSEIGSRYEFNTVDACFGNDFDYWLDYRQPSTERPFIINAYNSTVYSESGADWITRGWIAVLTISP